MKGWYKDFGERLPLPSQDEIKTTQKEYEDLYKKVISSGDKIEFDITLFDINDTAPEKEEVVCGLYRMHNNRTPGTSGIKVENLKRWHNKARPACKFNSRENDPPDPDLESVEIWEKVLKIIKLVFKEGEINEKVRVMLRVRVE